MLKWGCRGLAFYETELNPFNLRETENLPRILLVDDDKDHLRLFTMILEDGGYSVDAYTDPVEALLKFRPNYYDIAVLDYLMPDLNGLELYRRIREIDPRIRWQHTHCNP